MTLKLTFLFFKIMTYRTLKVREIKGQELSGLVPVTTLCHPISPLQLI